MIIIQTTVDDDKKAKELINLLVETNKIACGTFHEIQSSYKWNEKLVEEQEFELSMYTNENLMREVVDVVTQRHSYELPKITVLEPVYTLPEYDDWVKKQTS
tara:strand:+ start:539 stop:844 length:306 start_codon:yes stop_codon:yes gene_type:complete